MDKRRNTAAESPSFPTCPCSPTCRAQPRDKAVPHPSRQICFLRFVLGAASPGASPKQKPSTDPQDLRLHPSRQRPPCADKGKGKSLATRQAGVATSLDLLL